ncbi:MAG: NifU family protein [Candidatus Caenarcaniphilales bacterium]|nr:NifU family protein [Candidatus Caenarcaniphilales bacterium]
MNQDFGSIGLSLKINKVLTEVEQAVIADGGSIEIHEIDGKTIKLSLGGACVNCPSSQMTIKFGIEKRLKEEVDPEIEVINV